MMNVAEVKDWLNSQRDDDHIAIDDGGLSLVLVEFQEDCMEVGGIPEKEEEE